MTVAALAPEPSVLVMVVVGAVMLRRRLVHIR